MYTYSIPKCICIQGWVARHAFRRGTEQRDHPAHIRNKNGIREYTHTYTPS